MLSFAIFQQWLLSERLVVSISVLYISSVLMLSLGNKSKIPRVSGRLFDMLVFLHNVGLALYSAYSHYALVRIVKRHFFGSSDGAQFYDLLCDRNQKLWRQEYEHIWLFYASKYYELLDTYIMLAKGKPSNFLQTYHHVGTIIGMWALVRSETSVAWLIAIPNTFIHTLMYTYYALTAVGYKPFWKKALTTAQMLQFTIGYPLVYLQFSIPSCTQCDSDVYKGVVTLFGIITVTPSAFRRLAIWYNTAFVLSLLGLFWDFSRRTYGRSARKQ